MNNKKQYLTIGERVRANNALPRYDGLYGKVLGFSEDSAMVDICFEWPERKARMYQMWKDYPNLRQEYESGSKYCFESVSLPVEGVNAFQTVCVDAARFLDALAKVNKALGKSVTSVIENVRIVFDGNNCIITGTNLEHWLEAKIPASGGSLGFVPDDTKALIKACKHFKGKIVFEGYQHDDTFKVSNDNKSATPRCCTDENCPEFPATESVTEYKANAKALSERIGKISYAAAIGKEARPILTGICFTGENIAAVNGMRLAVTKDPALTVEGEFVLPAKSLKLLDTFGTDDLRIYVSKKYVWFSNPSDNLRLCIRRFEDEFLKLEKVIPSDDSVKEIYTINTAEYLNELKYLKDMMISTHKECVKFEGGKLSLISERGDFVTKIKIAGRADIVYGFNCDYMLDALNHLKAAKSLTVKVCGHNMPIIMSDNQADTVVVLPVRLEEVKRRMAA